MNNDYLYRAKQAIPDVQVLSVVAAKRARQLAAGARPMIKCKDENVLDIALLEIAEGLLTYYFGDEDPEAAEIHRYILIGKKYWRFLGLCVPRVKFSRRESVFSAYLSSRTVTPASPSPYSPWR